MNITEIYADINRNRWVTSIGKEVGLSRATVRRLLTGQNNNDLALAKIIEAWKKRKRVVNKAFEPNF